MEEQNERLNKILKYWQDSKEQIDDITILGFEYLT
jgi:hypothetical protein